MKPISEYTKKRVRDYFKLPVLAGILALSLLFVILPVAHKKMPQTRLNAVQSIQQHAKIVLAVISPTASPSPTLSPSPTVSPSPEPPKGFCLQVPVIFYHHIQPQADAVAKKQTSISVDSGIFDQQMAYLSSHGYSTIFVDQLVNALTSHSSLPGKSVAITFDDGYKDNVTNALPILRKYNLKANLMLSSGLVSSNPDFLSWDDVMTLKSSGLFFFTDHTWSHYAVNHGTSDKIQYEIQTAQIQIQQHTGQPVNIFTYPYGSSNPLAVSLLQQDGFKAAFTTIPGSLQCESRIMTLPRIRIGNASMAAYGF